VNRQTRLAEVGAHGQARLESASCVLSESRLAGFIEERYVRGAGVKNLVRGSKSNESFEDLEPSAREIAKGSHAALVSIREILGV